MHIILRLGLSVWEKLFKDVSPTAVNWNYMFAPLVHSALFKVDLSLLSIFNNGLVHLGLQHWHPPCFFHGALGNHSGYLQSTTIGKPSTVLLRETWFDSTINTHAKPLGFIHSRSPCTDDINYSSQYVWMKHDYLLNYWFSSRRYYHNH